MLNEFNEKINDKLINQFTIKIRKLSKKQIDEFWHKCGWKDKEKGKNQALPDWRLEKIKKDSDFAKKNIINLLLETPKKESLKNFKNIKE